MCGKHCGVASWVVLQWGGDQSPVNCKSLQWGGGQSPVNCKSPQRGGGQSLVDCRSLQIGGDQSPVECRSPQMAGFYRMRRCTRRQGCVSGRPGSCGFVLCWKGVFEYGGSRVHDGPAMREGRWPSIRYHTFLNRSIRHLWKPPANTARVCHQHEARSSDVACSSGVARLSKVEY